MSKTERYRIYIIGCHDCTEVEMDLTREQLSVLNQLEILVNEKSEEECQPTIDIRLIKDNKKEGDNNE